MRRTFLALIIALALAQVAPQASEAQPPQEQSATGDDSGSLQKATQSPVSSLISVPVQSDTDFDIGPFNRSQGVLNIQPVIPIGTSADWNLVIRWITPVIWQPTPGTADLEVFGIEENTPAYFAAQEVQAQAGAQNTPVGPEGTQVATQETPVAAANSDELRKEAQNPVASLISVPAQDNINGGIFPGDRNQNVLNIQPVIPLKVNDDWNLIIRWITPIIYQPLPVPTSSPQLGVSGLGDMQPTFLLSPRKPHKIIWGIGPIFQLPTATSQYLGQGKLGIGPNVVVLAMPSHFVLGVLVNNIWSVAGGGKRPDVNQMLLQYFINYNMKKGWYLTTQPIITANWNSPAPSGSVWTVPFGGGVGRIMKLGFQPVNINVQAYGNAVHVPGASPWTVRAQFTLLFPKLTGEQKKMLLEQKLKQMEQEQPQKQ